MYSKISELKDSVTIVIHYSFINKGHWTVFFILLTQYVFMCGRKNFHQKFKRSPTQTKMYLQSQYYMHNRNQLKMPLTLNQLYMWKIRR